MDALYLQHWGVFSGHVTEGALSADMQDKQEPDFKSILKNALQCILIFYYIKLPQSVF